MRNFVINSFIFLLSVICGYSSVKFLTGYYELGLIFVSGMLFGLFLMNLRLNVKNDKITSYKRELEKESLLSDESSSKVKVLEAKINVLEKALENALKKEQ